MPESQKSAPNPDWAGYFAQTSAGGRTGHNQKGDVVPLPGEKGRPLFAESDRRAARAHITTLEKASGDISRRDLDRHTELMLRLIDLRDRGDSIQAERLIQIIQGLTGLVQHTITMQSGELQRVPQAPRGQQLEEWEPNIFTKEDRDRIHGVIRDAKARRPVSVFVAETAVKSLTRHMAVDNEAMHLTDLVHGTLPLTKHVMLTPEEIEQSPDL